MEKIAQGRQTNERDEIVGHIGETGAEAFALYAMGKFPSIPFLAFLPVAMKQANVTQAL